MNGGLRAPGAIALGTGVALLALTAQAAMSDPGSVAVSPQTMPRIADVDERYQSYNVEMAEVIGGNFWKPYDRASIAALRARSAAGPAKARGIHVGQDATMFQARAPIDLANVRLRMLAAALGPSYVRTSGTWANTVYFHDADTPAPHEPPAGFKGVLTRAEWKGVIDFAHAVNADVVTSFAVSAGVRDAGNVWTADQAKHFLAYTEAVGGTIAAAEMFNEPTMPTYGGAPKGYDAAAYARDFAVFRRFAKATAPDMRIVGPGGVGEGLETGMLSGVASGGVLPTADLLSATPRPVFDVFSYHFYGAVSLRCASLSPAATTMADAALSEAWLARTDAVNTFYEELRDRFEPGKAVWITETADAACGGNPWASTFLDTFRYVDQLGRLAKRGVAVVFHNTLASSEYGLLEQRDFTPRPSYWAALLWRRLMGTGVLDAGPSRAGLHLYAHCRRDHPGGITLLAINTSSTQPASVDVPLAAERYTLTAQKLEDTTVQLNGNSLAVDANEVLPILGGTPVPAGGVALPPASITFLTIADAGNASCR
jgi:hypothetical protein